MMMMMMMMKVMMNEMFLFSVVYIVFLKLGKRVLYGGHLFLG